MLATADNRAYLASCLRHPTQIQPDEWTSDTLEPLSARVEKNRQNKTYHTKI